MKLPLDGPGHGGGTAPQDGGAPRSTLPTRQARRHAAWATSGAARFGLRSHSFREMVRLAQEAVADPHQE